MGVGNTLLGIGIMLTAGSLIGFSLNIVMAKSLPVMAVSIFIAMTGIIIAYLGTEIAKQE